MNTNEHPDFKVTTFKSYCHECEKETEFQHGLVLNAGDGGPPTYTQCTVCGFDEDAFEYDE